SPGTSTVTSCRSSKRKSRHQAPSFTAGGSTLWGLPRSLASSGTGAASVREVAKSAARDRDHPGKPWRMGIPSWVGRNRVAPAWVTSPKRERGIWLPARRDNRPPWLALRAGVRVGHACQRSPSLAAGDALEVAQGRVHPHADLLALRPRLVRL